MPNNQFKRGELYSFITGKASTAIARRLQKNFKLNGLDITIEQWSVLYHLWKEDGLNQQELCNATFRDKPSITRLGEAGIFQGRQAEESYLPDRNGKKIAGAIDGSGQPDPE
jgi:hypothetical protein